MADIKISELTQVEALSLSDLMETAIPNNGGFLSRRMSMAQLSNYLENSVNHTALSTTAKSIIGAINEIVLDLLNYYTTDETYSKTEVDTLIAGVSGLHFLVVSQLPTTDIDVNTIYLVPKQDVGTQDIYDEYIYIVEEAPTPSHWEKIGTTEIDLSDYVTDTELTTILNDYVTSSGLNTILANYATTSAMTTALADKVDKVSGKGLSTEDYTTTEKAKLNGIESGAEVNPTVATGSVFGSLSFDGVDKTVQLKAINQPANQDLNDYRTEGFYYFSSSATPANIPIGVNGLLLVLKYSDSLLKQIWFRQGTVNSNDHHTFIRHGGNNTWSDWHEIITAEMIAGVEFTNTASKAYAVNDYMIYNATFYRVTNAIASGGTISASGSGANITKALVGDELTSIKNSIPTVNNKTISITQNGTAVDSFTLNQNSNKTIEVKDEKVKQTEMTDDRVMKSLAIASDNTTTTDTDGVEKCNGLAVRLRKQPRPELASTVDLCIGNDIPVGTTDNYVGVIRMFGTHEYSTLIHAGNSTDEREIVFPDADGTLALQSEIPTIPTVATGSTFGSLSFDGTDKNIDMTADLIGSGLDANNLKASAVYYVTTANTPANMPAAFSNGFLIVLRYSANNVKQIVFRQGTINSNDHQTYFRTYTSSGWSKWHQLIVGELIGGVEDTSTASRAYAVNELINRNGGIFRVTQAIASGETISASGSSANVTSTTLSAEIKAIRDALNI